MILLVRIVLRLLADLAGLVALSLRHRRFVEADINSVPLVADRNDPGHVPPGLKAFQWHGRRGSTKVKVLIIIVDIQSLLAGQRVGWRRID